MSAEPARVPVPRTTAAESPAEVVAAVRRRAGPPAAWWGMVILIASEATLFGAFIGTYYYLRFETPIWPPPGIPEPKALVPLILVACLAVTAVPMLLAYRSAAAGRLGAARRYLVLALVVQAGYFAYEVHDFRDQLHTFDITRNAYSSIYYTLLGADHAHVLLGILFTIWLIAKLARGLTTYRVNAAQAIAWYWLAVILLTFAVIGTLLSARV
jgi:heme/copper-type cytochrome/quinol oxidase subunit 3